MLRFYSQQLMSTISHSAALEPKVAGQNQTGRDARAVQKEPSLDLPLPEH